jgi:hypothetical protein
MRVSTQLPPHETVPPVHPIVVHTPLLQTSPAPHWTPHAPQFLSSLLVSTHAPPQAIFPMGHVQRPPTQVVPFPHVVPHAPQWFALDVRSTHAPPHALRPAPHVAAQAPLLQTGVAPVHWIPHPPQWFGSEEGSAQVPAQSLVPAGQTHLPALQFWVAVHDAAHDPQWLALLVVSTHAPPQFVRLELQVAAHTPRSQTRSWHAAPHAPQFFGSLRRSAQLGPQVTSSGRVHCDVPPEPSTAASRATSTSKRMSLPPHPGANAAPARPISASPVPHAR